MTRNKYVWNHNFSPKNFTWCQQRCLHCVQHWFPSWKPLILKRHKVSSQLAWKEHSSKCFGIAMHENAKCHKHNASSLFCNYFRAYQSPKSLNKWDITYMAMAFDIHTVMSNVFCFWGANISKMTCHKRYALDVHYT